MMVGKLGFLRRLCRVSLSPSPSSPSRTRCFPPSLGCGAGLGLAIPGPVPARCLTYLPRSFIFSTSETESKEDDGMHSGTHRPNCFCRYDPGLFPKDVAAADAIDDEAEFLQEESLRPLLDASREPLLINKGDHVDLQKLLFTQERDYLMKPDGQKVKMEGLSNKCVLLYIFPLVRYDYTVKLMTRELVELHSLLWDKGCFEIVFVGLDSDLDSSKQKEYFGAYSSQMTWPFLPYEDHDARHQVRSTFGFSDKFVADKADNFPRWGIVADKGDNFPYCGIVDPTGKVLQSWSWDILNYYGHDAFPFTDEKIISLYKEEASMFAEGMSLKALLGTSNRDYLLSPKGDKVPIEDLEDKVVCIILDDPIPFSHLRSFKGVFKELKLDAHCDFIPVYVCRHFTNTSCSQEYMNIDDKAKKECESVGWLRIPLGDSSARKIWRVIMRRCVRDLHRGTYCNVVGPHGSYVDFYALYYMEQFGSEAYPFTTRRVAELQAQELQDNFSLEHVLEPACEINRDGEVVLHPDCRIPCYGGQQDGQAFVLNNKRLLVLFGTRSCCEFGQFLCELKLLYNQNKGTDEEFEVIYIPLDCERSDYDESTSGMPWFVFPFGRKEMANRLNVWKNWQPFCWSNIPVIMAFERDGRLVGMEGDLNLKKVKQARFPYVESILDLFIKLNLPLPHLNLYTSMGWLIKKCSVPRFESALYNGI